LSSTIVSKASQAFEQSFEKVLTPAEADYLRPHKKRILKSIEWLAPYIREDSSILEMGGGMFPYIFQATSSEIRGDNTNTDLRLPLPIQSEQYDVVVNTELIEHLKDRVDSPVELFDFSGLRMLLSESYRVLKPGGITFVTTPNACSFGTIYRILMGWPHYYYLPHVREYTIHEIKNFLEELHFSVERMETLDVYDDLSSDKREEILSLLAGKGYSLDYRGECTFIIARK
jgi:SAM-dependent methyltransferase